MVPSLGVLGLDPAQKPAPNPHPYAVPVYAV